ncbi:MAG: glycoside hydrolase family 9 protein [Ruminococcus callidus]|uniref:glycoside hydrolase family 9 protein n=1 Tax=Ruminococcus callidus TaxID=40519 RepID=UPI0023F3CA44|nr:glycoside hydrolase family 9 protein [Ruminococcus callidus]MBS6597104.1 glycoside hydrolase family 9 protein [Ruminococcus callidus]
MNWKGNLKKKLTAVLSAGVLAVTGTVSAVSGMTASAQPSAGTYGDALKLSLYFFDANQCGADDNVLTWRGKCHTYDAEASLSSAKGLSSSSVAAIKAANGGLDTVDVSGGYHDAGDHLKFSNTMGYSCTNLAWSYFENPDSYKETGSEDHLLYILKKMCDYFMKVTYLDDSGNVIAFCYMVGDDQDHNIWTAPEVQTQNRPTYWADASNPSVDASGHMAAALAATSLAFRDKNADYADACLKYANALEKFTEKYPKATYEGIGSYYSCGNIEDKVAWSDLWCAIANNNGKLPDSYQAQYTPSNGVYNGSIYDYWVYSWDKVWGGYSALLYSMDPQKYSAHGSELVFDMDQLVGNKNQAYYPVGGGWGASRYNCAWQMYALTYAKYTSGQDKYNEYAQGQMDYLLGNNPANRSYLIGFGDSYPQHIHHRAANPDKDTAKYILYGTLVGGPTDANGSYDDNTNSYSCTEPALDYNGCFALAIAGLYAVYGGSTTAAQSAIASASEINSDFVFSYGSETPQPGTTTTEQTTTTTEETTTTTEESTVTTEKEKAEWADIPYYIIAGDDFSASISYTGSNPDFQWTSSDPNVLEVEGSGLNVTLHAKDGGTVTLTATNGSITLTKEIGIMTEVFTTSTTEETTTTTTESVTTDSDETTATTSGSETTTTTKGGDVTPASLYGDVNLDGRVDITDAVMLNKAAANTVQLSEQQRSNADCDANNEVDSNDAVVLLKFLVSIIKTLPEVAE